MNHVTYIDDLPDLSDLENNNRGNNMQTYDQQPNAYAKHIRNNYKPPVESGMHHNSDQRIQPRMNSMQQYYVPEYYEQSNNESMVKNTEPTCVDMAEHAQNCPVCSKIYNCDKTIYIVAIVFLIIVCIILLKKVLDV